MTWSRHNTNRMPLHNVEYYEPTIYVGDIRKVTNFINGYTLIGKGGGRKILKYPLRVKIT